MNWKERAKHAIPPSVLNKLLLACPDLYRSSLINYESNLDTVRRDELLAHLEKVQTLGGDVIECGSSRCGTSIIMANHLLRKGVRKQVFACDSFQGFDRFELEEERKTGLTTETNEAYTSTSFEYVRGKLKKLRVNGVVTPVKGYFRDTLPRLQSRWCLAFIDCDLQKSVLYCAETLWPHLVSAGRIVFDDYTCEFFRGVKPAVDSFVERRLAEIASHGLRKGLYFVCKK